MISKQAKKQMLVDRVKKNSTNSLQEHPYKNIEMNKFIFNELNKIKDKRIERVYSLRYFSGEKMTWSTIGKQLGFSSQTAINLHKRGAEILKRRIKEKK
jgi:DNA-directed RNA polymerase specialized sigma subunit|tara:strand:- start:300 stop:596 length:297 start_codon:yes stop_codon:yes gene_type:complete